jgi:hypothetical protein
MAAAPRSGTMFFRGTQTGRTYAVDVYVSDVVGGAVTFDSGAGASATSDTFYIAPENIILNDFSIASGLTDTAKISINANGVQTGNRLRYANHLNSLNNRPLLGVPFRAGSKIACSQEA